MPLNIEELRPIFVVLLTTDDGYHGLVEHSMAIAAHTSRVRLWWTWGVADGRADAENNAKYATGARAADIWDAHDPALPIVIDWDGWVRDNEPAKTLSGVRDKFRARNAMFTIRPESP